MVKILSSKLVGGVFIIAAILKLISIDEFEIYIYSFNIFSFLLTTFVSRIIIIGEFILGLFLILKINYKFTWRISLLTLTLFTLFLTYTAIFRQDSNCHCFGELIELSPLESIIKNVILILLLLLSQKSKDKRQKALSEVQSSKFFVLCSSFFVLLVFIISPPDSIYKMLYSTEKEVSSIDLYESFDEVTQRNINRRSRKNPASYREEKGSSSGREDPIRKVLSVKEGDGSPGLSSRGLTGCG